MDTNARIYQGIEPFNAVLGILNKDTDKLVASNDDGFPTTLIVHSNQ